MGERGGEQVRGRSLLPGQMTVYCVLVWYAPTHTCVTLCVQDAEFMEKKRARRAGGGGGGEGGGRGGGGYGQGGVGGRGGGAGPPVKLLQRPPDGRPVGPDDGRPGFAGGGQGER